MHAWLALKSSIFRLMECSIKKKELKPNHHSMNKTKINFLPNYEFEFIVWRKQCRFHHLIWKLNALIEKAKSKGMKTVTTATTPK